MKIVFLDRDGVINQFPGHGAYVTRVKDFHFITGSREAIKALSAAGYKIIVVSNQAGVGKGLFSEDKLKRITRKLLEGVKASGGKITKVFYCTHLPSAQCDCRKPKIGNIKNAAAFLGQPLSAFKGAFFVGDAQSDVMLAKEAGLKSILVLTGKETRRSVKQWPQQPDLIVDDLKGAVEKIFQ